MILERERTPMHQPKKPGILRHVKPNLKGYGGWTAASAIFISLEVLLEVLIPMLMAVIVDGGLYRKEDFLLKSWFPPELIANQTRFVLTVGGIMVITACLSMACGVMSGVASSIASQGFARNLRAALLEKIQSFSFANTDHFSASSLITRATTDVNTMRNTMQQMIRTMVRAPFMVIMASVMALSISGHLAAIFLLAIPILAVTLVVLMRIGQPRFKAMLRKFDGMNHAVQENLIGIRVVKAFVRGDYESKRFEDTAEELRHAQLASSRLFTLTGPIQMLVMWGCSIILLYTGGHEILFRTTGLTTGQLMSLVSYTTQAVSALTMLSWVVMAISRTQASLYRINEVLDEQIDIADGSSDAKVADGSVDFEDVCFSYTKDPDKLALRHIDLHIKSGETVGVIGGTGEGKSTLVSLIPRFYDTLSGTVKVGGRNVRDYTLENLRDGVSMVLQNGALFSGTIAANLRWGDPDASEERLREACAIACADEFIDRFPEGYDTVLEQNAANLSGGQRQRLRIARAIVKQPKILILDDSTSAVDMATDEHIRKALRTAMPGTTKIIIAQRIASIMTCDRIVVLDEGSLSDVGTHRELMARSQIYRDVYDSQMREEAEQHA
ncbi:MAG: ABC transporter ATP-binding protein [Candidatus Avoscillospira sp.]